ncbi:hypothetical protein LDZ44_05400 [Bacteroides xylanisolvens]|uniref:hypothetical protein n=1 Tax=Bacteroides xylanisolvens TaxID=371601 RepID=UPI001CDCAA7C|nr:hypothetical protein [Bacteroides xylanisolvens]MCA4464642.1 hypothetical protein [Bacteroides xylanisolvens]MCA4469116.1 hypothetical protein [Bacteroides xylanisolvens]MCA4478380.1 hypothetical protein [Bacteroides xylanisolvens]MCA4487621.1 hypothetical protein [Bacteroides xylanisolvens]MCA4491881.1 hypothetical protein [Bacteroides xylanisolvens]
MKTPEDFRMHILVPGLIWLLCAFIATLAIFKNVTEWNVVAYLLFALVLLVIFAIPFSIYLEYRDKAPALLDALILLWHKISGKKGTARKAVNPQSEEIATTEAVTSLVKGVPEVSTAEPATVVNNTVVVALSNQMVAEVQNNMQANIINDNSTVELREIPVMREDESATKTDTACGMDDKSQTEPEGSVEQSESPLQKSTSFKDCIIVQDKDGVLSMLQELSENLTGVKLFVIIKAAMKAGVITRPSHKQMQEIFGERTTSKQNFNNYFGGGCDSNISDEQMAPYVSRFEKFM